MGARIGYGAIVAAFWALGWGYAAYISFAWFLGKAPYLGPWDRSIHPEKDPVSSFFLVGAIVSVCMLAVSLAGLTTCLAALVRVRRGGNTVVRGGVALDGVALTLVLALSLVLCVVLSWWLQNFTD